MLRLISCVTENAEDEDAEAAEGSKGEESPAAAADEAKPKP